MTLVPLVQDKTRKSTVYQSDLRLVLSIKSFCVEFKSGE